MPRKRELKRRTETDALEAWALHPEVEEIVRKHDKMWNARGVLSENEIDTLTGALVREIAHAQAGLRGIVTGKNAKPDAWTMDIFVAGICRAFREIGRPVAMSPKAAGSRVQTLAKDVAAMARLPDQGDLFHQMQRAKNIERRKLPDVLILHVGSVEPGK